MSCHLNSDISEFQNIEQQQQHYHSQPREYQQELLRQQQQQRQQQQIHDQIIQLHKLQQQSEKILTGSGYGQLFDGIFDPVTLALTAGAFTTTTTTAATAGGNTNQGNTSNNNTVLDQQYQQQNITNAHGTPTPATASILSLYTIHLSFFLLW